MKLILRSFTTNLGTHGKKFSFFRSVREQNQSEFHLNSWKTSQFIFYTILPNRSKYGNLDRWPLEQWFLESRAIDDRTFPSLLLPLFLLPQLDDGRRGAVITHFACRLHLWSYADHRWISWNSLHSYDYRLLDMHFCLYSSLGSLVTGLDWEGCPRSPAQIHFPQ